MNEQVIVKRVIDILQVAKNANCALWGQTCIQTIIFCGI